MFLRLRQLLPALAAAALAVTVAAAGLPALTGPVRTQPALAQLASGRPVTIAPGMSVRVDPAYHAGPSHPAHVSHPAPLAPATKTPARAVTVAATATARPTAAHRSTATVVPAHQATTLTVSGRPLDLSAKSPVTNATLTSVTVPLGGPATGTYTLSSAVYNFLTSTLAIPLGDSPTLAGTESGQTLTLNVGAPGQLPVTLPAGIGTPTFGPTTITVDTAANTLTLSASGNATSNSPQGDLNVTIANAATSALSNGTDLTATLSVSGIPFIGSSTAQVSGQLSYTGGTLGASLAGTLTSPATFAGGAVTISAGATVSLATNGGLTVSGEVIVTYGPNGSHSLITGVDGAVTDAQNWHLTVSDTGDQTFNPIDSVSFTPDFTGTIADTGGTVGFTLTSAPLGAGGGFAWSPGDGAEMDLTSVTVSTMAPPDDASCPDGYSAGQLWVGLQGQFSYSPAGLTLNSSGCIVPAAGQFTIKTDTTGTLSDIGGTPVSLTQAGLTATRDSSGFQVTGTASLDATDPSTNTPIEATVTMSFGSFGFLAAGTVSLSGLSSALDGSDGGTTTAAVIVSSSQIQGFDPAEYGLDPSVFGPAFPASVSLAEGLTLTYSGVLPASFASMLSSTLNVSVPMPAVQAIASLGSNGFSIDLDANFAATGKLKIFDINGSSLYFDDIDFGFQAGSAGVAVHLAGSADMTLAEVIKGAGSSSGVVTVSGSFDIDKLRFTLGLAASDWTFGNSGVSADSLGLQVGFDLETLTPTIALSAESVSLPSQVATAIGLGAGTKVTFDGNFDVEQPLLHLVLNGTAGNPALKPLQAAYNDGLVSAAELNSFVVNSADIYIAPLGGITASGVSVPVGFSVDFSTVIEGQTITADASVSTSPPGMQLAVTLPGSVSLGQVTLSMVTFELNTDPSAFTFSLVGAIQGNGLYLYATLNLSSGSSVIGGGLVLTAYLNWASYLQFNGKLYATIGGSDSSPTFSASGQGQFYAGGTSWGSVQFTWSPGSSSIDWGDTIDTISQIITFFKNAGTSGTTILTVLENLGLSQAQALVTLLQYGIST